MPPRRLAAAFGPSQGVPSPTTKLGDLPDEVLVRCLALLSAADRCAHAVAARGC